MRPSLLTHRATRAAVSLCLVAGALAAAGGSWIDGP
jgi:hypothetical protein